MGTTKTEQTAGAQANLSIHLAHLSEGVWSHVAFHSLFVLRLYTSVNSMSHVEHGQFT